MARIINSPGVQISEKDISLRVTNPAGTHVLVSGFSQQGPVGEPIVITTATELEAIYGVPTTPAEKYFYYSCREVLNSPAVLTTLRLPYGPNTGSAFSNSYSALFYPAASGVLANGTVEWVIGAPTHISLSPTDYAKYLEGDINWAATATTFATTSAGSVSSVGIAGTTASALSAGFIILNDLQTTINEVSEGYYVGLADNLAVSVDSVDFNSITSFRSLSANGSFTSVSTSRLDFVLSATSADSLRGVVSISEQLEKVGFVGFETSQYQDHLSLGVFKVRKSTTDGAYLSLATTERYLGSLDSNRKKINENGGVLSNAFLEDIINDASPTVKMLINPRISKTFAWNGNQTVAPIARVTVSNAAKALFPVGVFVPNSRNIESTKVIGDVPSKLDKALRSVETPENVVVDVVADAGLSTVYALTEAAASSFNDEFFVSDVTTLYEDWQAVSNELVSFAENTRRDCVTIIDPLRSIFISGKDNKIINTESKTFSQNIYTPLKQTAGSFESSFAGMYGNWVKINDYHSSRKMWIPFSGFAAAAFARNDSVANPWSAPAGLSRGTFNCVDLAFNPNQKQRDRLYEISVNPVVFFAGDGYTIMGQKTLQSKPTAFDRFNVRRLFLTLERSVQRTLKYFVFEPNTEFTRTRVRSAITPLLEFAKNTEGLYDYLIVVDERNNTPQVIDNNEMVVDIYIKPVRTAEFILVNFVATRTGQDFQELA